jgi:hypothetical protein
MNMTYSAIAVICLAGFSMLSGLGQHVGLLVAVVSSPTLSVKLSCPAEASPNPKITLTVTNVGSKKIEIPDEAVYQTVSLIVKDQAGNIIAPKHGREDTDHGLVGRPLEPGASLELNTRGDRALPPLVYHAISDWGYRDLPTGTYNLTASATSPAVPSLSSECAVTVSS